jgi:hypothetical protein
MAQLQAGLKSCFIPTDPTGHEAKLPTASRASKLDKTSMKVGTKFALK